MAETNSVASFTHWSRAEVNKGGEGKVEGVRRVVREGVRGRVWDSCPSLVHRLNERRIRVKCSICAAIKSWD